MTAAAVRMIVTYFALLHGSTADYCETEQSESSSCPLPDVMNHLSKSNSALSSRRLHGLARPRSSRYPQICAVTSNDLGFLVQAGNWMSQP